MKNSTLVLCAVVFLVFVGVAWAGSVTDDANVPKCLAPGCNNERAKYSGYCNLHKPSSGSASTYGSYSYSSKSSSSSSKSDSKSTSSYSSKSTTTKRPSYSGNTKKSTTTKKKSYESYDDGYDDVYMDGDYDYDRYNNDRDYAYGVDDAIEEYEEEGEEW